MWVELLVGLIIVVAVWLSVPNGREELIATLVGVFVGIRLEHWFALTRERSEAKESRQLIRDELEANRAAVDMIAGEEKDYPAVVASVLDLKTGFWSALSSAGRLHLLGGLELLHGVNRAYAAIEDLRTIADLFFRDAKWVVTTHGAGLNPTFDAKRKERAREAADAIRAAITAFDS